MVAKARQKVKESDAEETFCFVSPDSRVLPRHARVYPPRGVLGRDAPSLLWRWSWQLRIDTVPALRIRLAPDHAGFRGREKKRTRRASGFRQNTRTEDAPPNPRETGPQRGAADGQARTVGDRLALLYDQARRRRRSITSIAAPAAAPSASVPGSGTGVTASAAAGTPAGEESPAGIAPPNIASPAALPT